MPLDDPYADIALRQTQLGDRRKAIADQIALARTQLAAQQNGRMVGKFYVPNRGASLVPAAASIAGSFMQPVLDRQQSSLNAEEQSAVQQLLGRLNGVQELKQMPGPPTQDGQGPAPVNVTRPLTSPEKLQTYQLGMQLPSVAKPMGAAFQDELVNAPIRQETRQNRVEDREDLQQARKDLLTDNLTFKREQLGELARQADVRSQDARLAAADRAQAAKESAFYRNAMLQLHYDMFGYRKEHDREVLDAKKGGGAVNDKPLGVGDLTKLQGLAGHVESADRFRDNFKDEYAGLSGEVRRAIGTYSPIANQSTKDTSAFWNDYQAHKNDVRHNLFGSALTATEKSEWEKSDISPSMQPDMIRRNLERRATLERNAYDKIEGAVRSGSRVDQLSTIRPSQPASSPTPIAPAAPTTIRRYNPQTGRVE